jgi:hypothetical protein
VNWIHSVVQAHSESESPSRFFYWAAITSMSAVLRKNVWINRHFYKLYPNVYVLLFATSGMKKGNPVSLTKNLVEKSEATRIISGRSSMPRVIQDLGKVKTSPNSVQHKEAQVLIISGELSSFLVKDLDGLNVLTDLYNTHEHEEKWENSLKGTGVDTLIKPCITLLGATNDDHFAQTIPQAAVRGGFIARTFIIYASERGTPNSLVDAPTNLVDISTFVPFLKELAKLKGEFKWTKETGDYYRSWYVDFMRNLPQNDSTGYYNRVGDSILKLAMILSLSKRLKLEMDLDSLEEAKAECLNCGKAAHQASMGGSNSLSNMTRILLQALINDPYHKLTRTQILRRFWGDIDSFNLDLIAETLIQAGMIKVENMSKERTYIMKDSVVDEYKNYVKRAQNT